MRIKYPRTFHLPDSPGASSDDKILKDISNFHGKDVVVTEKLDGENCTMTNSEIYARSTSSNGGILRERCKRLWAEKCFYIPEKHRLCGENMQWQHSIRYENLISPFYLFSFWNWGVCLSWEETVCFSAYSGIPTVPILFEGKFENIPKFDLTNKEGYVIRVKKEFHIDDFDKSIAKWVRANHVTTDEHWSKNLIENGFSK